MAKGRDKELIRKRNEALCRRYYFWTEVQGLRFDRALKILSEQEFFISEERIMPLSGNAARLIPTYGPYRKCGLPVLHTGSLPCSAMMQAIL